MNGNFKAKCVNARNNNCYTNGKVYEIVNGKFIDDKGNLISSFNDLKTFEDLVDYSMSQWEEVKENQIIIIYPKGNEVIATIKEGKKVVKSAKAICNPSDTFDFEYGAKLALARVFNPDVKRLEIETVKSIKKVKRPAKVGEWIEIVSYCNPELIGEVAKVLDISECGIRFEHKKIWEQSRTSKPGYEITRFSKSSIGYVVLENYTPETKPINKPLSEYTNKEIAEELLRRYSE